MEEGEEEEEEEKKDGGGEGNRHWLVVSGGGLSAGAQPLAAGCQCRAGPDGLRGRSISTYRVCGGFEGPAVCQLSVAAPPPDRLHAPPLRLMPTRLPP